MYKKYHTTIKTAITNLIEENVYKIKSPVQLGFTRDVIKLQFMQGKNVGQWHCRPNFRIAHHCLLVFRVCICILNIGSDNDYRMASSGVCSTPF